MRRDQQKWRPRPVGGPRTTTKNRGHARRGWPPRPAKRTARVVDQGRRQRSPATRRREGQRHHPPLESGGRRNLPKGKVRRCARQRPAHDPSRAGAGTVDTCPPLPCPSATD
ncbi:hypothetical protein GS506_06220 [Rhodococcus hoagii]|nr:hypothetical protein [Prescottella equi]